MTTQSKVWKTITNKAGRLIVAAAVTTCMGLAPDRAAAADRDFWLLNETERTIVGVQLSPHRMNAWANNVLLGLEMPSHTGTKILFLYDLEICNMDLRVVFDDGTVQYHRQGRDVCRASAIQLFEGGSQQLTIDGGY